MPWPFGGLSGSRQRRIRFDPEAPTLREEAVAALRWGTQADRENRDAVQRMTPAALERGRSKLMRVGMKIRRGPQGTEWLLYRGEGRCDTTAKFKSRSSWSPYVGSAQRFARVASQKHESCPHRTAAWVPENVVVSIPFMYGNEMKAWGGDQKGRFIYHAEREIVADPFTPSEHETSAYSPEFDALREKLTTAIEIDNEEQTSESRQRVTRLRAKAIAAANNELDRSLVSDLDKMRGRK